MFIIVHLCTFFDHIYIGISDDNIMKQMKIKTLFTMTLLILAIFTITPIATADSELEEAQSNQNDKGTCGYINGLFIGKIDNLDRFSPEITFHAVSVTLYPKGLSFNNEDVTILRPCFGILTPNFVCAFGTIKIGW